MNFTKEKIKEYKDKYGKIFKVESEGYSCLLRKPTRKELAYITPIINTDPLKANETLLKMCWVDGDTIFQEDDAYFLGVCPLLSKLVESKNAEILEL